MDRNWYNVSRVRTSVVRHITNYHLYLILSAMSIVVFCLVLLLYVEYRFFYSQSYKMILLQKQYNQYIKEVKKVFCNQGELPGFERSGGCDTINDRSFTPVNRAMSYLKESAENYFKEQCLGSPVDQIYELPSQNSASAHKSTTRKKTFRSPKKKRPVALSLDHKTDFIWPIDRTNFWVSSYYGPRKKSFHYGLDMAAVRGTPVHPAAVGRVEQAGFVSGYGNMVTVLHNKTYKTRYAHLDQIHVKAGQIVKPTDVIGMVGDTGFTIKTGTDASHLHFEVCEHGKQINPLHVLPR